MAIEEAKYGRERRSEESRAEYGVQNRAVEPEECAGAAEIAKVIEVGCDARNHEHGHAETR